jgi:hypothetical protein
MMAARARSETERRRGSSGGGSTKSGAEMARARFIVSSLDQIANAVEAHSVASDV